MPGVERSPTDPGSPAELAWRDDLTGAWNRRHLRRLLTEEWPRLTAAHPTITLLVLDLDGFKPINDTYGHAAGDRVLRWAADELRRGFREGDQLIRYGGDEFVVSLPGVSAADARWLAERARAGFPSVAIESPATSAPAEVPISFSLGIASYPEDGASGEEVLAVADRRLYEEKRLRRGANVPPARGRLFWVATALGALAVAGLATYLAFRDVKRAPDIPPDPTSTVLEATPPPPVANEIVVRDEEELAALRAEVVELRAALAEARAGNERAEFAARIRSLEEQLATAEREAVVTPAGSSDVEASTGMRVGERRTREELVTGDAPSDGDTAPVAPSPEAPPGPVAPVASALEGSAANAVVVPPRLLQAPRVNYPPLARSRRREATVELRLTVDASGRVVAAEPIGAAAGLGFDEAAREAGMSARFAPGTRDGVAAPMETRLAIRFQLDSSRR
jgi:TonB family protein